MKGHLHTRRSQLVQPDRGLHCCFEVRTSEDGAHGERTVSKIDLALAQSMGLILNRIADRHVQQGQLCGRDSVTVVSELGCNQALAEKVFLLHSFLDRASALPQS